jgi:23S rRNA (adenine2503-C2)-methyltransferase
MNHLCDLTLDELKEWLVTHNYKEYHAKQIFSWVYEKFALDWNEMTNLSKDMRDSLSKAFKLPSLKLEKITDSEDMQTTKFLWRLHEGNLVESVLITSGMRRTICVSSQVGCPARCAFCASGQKGFVRNLRPGEIVEQLLQINRWLAPKKEKITNVVYMGMGEPFKNYEAVVKSIRLITDPGLLNLSQRRITVSTVGVTEGIRKFSTEGLKVNLVLSLHAPNQRIREKIIPYARKYPLEEILKAMDEYSAKTKRDITYEYILIDGINATPDHALELAHLLRGKQCTVNLIPYNPVPGVRLSRPDKKTIKEFRAVLFGCKIINTCRYTKGDDILAACGQLRLHQMDEDKKTVVESKDLNKLGIVK